MKRLFKIIFIYFIYLSILLLLIFFLLPNNKLSIITNNLYDENNNISSDKLNSLKNPTENNRKYVILTFDDGWSSQYEVYKMLKPFKGTLYICSGLIGQKDRLTLDNLKEMYNYGWDICNHTVHHTNLSKVSLKKAYDEIYSCSSWIKGNGFKRNNCYMHFAYPEGSYNEDIIKILKKQNMLTARTTNAGNDTSNLLELGRTSLHGMTKKNIHDKILSDEKLLILSFHRIIPDDAIEAKEIDLRESYFKEVIDSIVESKREVITITEWYYLNN